MLTFSSIASNGKRLCLTIHRGRFWDYLLISKNVLNKSGLYNASLYSCLKTVLLTVVEKQSEIGNTKDPLPVSEELNDCFHDCHSNNSLKLICNGCLSDSNLCIKSVYNKIGTLLPVAAPFVALWKV